MLYMRTVMSSLFLNDKKKSQALGCLPILLRIIRQRSTNKRANERKKNAHQNGTIKATTSTTIWERSVDECFNRLPTNTHIFIIRLGIKSTKEKKDKMGTKSMAMESKKRVCNEHFRWREHAMRCAYCQFWAFNCTIAIYNILDLVLIRFCFDRLSTFKKTLSNTIQKPYD